MKQLTALERSTKCVYVNADLLLYYFYNTKQDFQTTASICFFYLDLFISSFYHEAHKNEERHLLCSFYFTMYNSNLEKLFSGINTHLFLSL